MKHFTIKEVKPKIFHLNFKDRYQLAMHFLRYQEFYESPNPKFRNHSFELVDFMEWYQQAFGNGTFTYPGDWTGFNIPSDIILKVDEAGIEDFNKYDEAMMSAYNTCAKKIDSAYNDACWGPKFYIIGSVGTEGSSMRHEIAHGFFYTKPDYKQKMTALVKALSPRLRNKIYKKLEKVGYTPHVYVDECQAYMSTGMFNDIKLSGEDKPFIQIYDEYYNA